MNNAAHKRHQLDQVDQRYAADSWAWKEDQFRTFDEHDPEMKPEGKPFPTHKAYIRAQHEIWSARLPDGRIAHPFLLEEKSRQLMETWHAIGNHVHLAQYTPRRRVLAVSMNEEKSLELLDRAWFVYEKQDDFVRARNPARLLIDKRTIQWENGSVFVALPKGKHNARSLVCSAFLFDEMAFHDFAEELFMGAIPGLVGDGRRGGRFTGISTAGPGPFASYVNGIKHGSPKRAVMQGLDLWEGEMELKAGAEPVPFSLVRLHYTADPDPYVATKVQQARALYESLGKIAWFFREYEIVYDSMSGQRIWPQLSEKVHGIEASAMPPEWMNWQRFRVIDPGYRNHCACIWAAVSPPGWRGCVDEKGVEIPVIVIYREMHVRGKTVPQLHAMITERSGDEKYVATLIDPSADIHKGNEQAGQSTFEQFRELDLGRMIKADNSVAAGLDEVRRRLAVYGKTPALLIFNNLEETWKWCTAYKYKDKGERWVLENDAREDEVSKKDDHIPDCVRYLCQFRPVPKARKGQKAPPNSFHALMRSFQRRTRLAARNRDPRMARVWA